jgi:hypothetical protein
MLMEGLEGTFAFALEGDIRHRQKPRRERAILPNLTHIESFPESAEDLRVLFHLMSNRLVSLQIDIAWGIQWPSFPRVADCARLVEEIVLTAPKLNHLRFCNPVGQWTPTILEHAGATLADLLGIQPTLQRLDIDVSLWTYLTHKSFAMTYLAELHLKGIQGLTDSNATTNISLPSLRRLYLDVQSNITHTCRDLLSSTGSTIEAIEVHATINIRDVIELFGVIGLSCPSLRSLELTNNFKGDQTLSKDLLVSLHPCHELVHMRIHGVLGCDPSLYLRDEDMRSMALAWPNLEALSFVPGYSSISGAGPTPTLSLYSLHHLCVLCPKLRSVQLTMKTVPIPLLPVRLSRSNYTPLESLHFGNSPIEDPYAIARWLGDACLPDGIRSSAGRAGDKQGELWVQVRNTVALLQEARREGEMRRRDE